jgi:hypothetical protein
MTDKEEASSRSVRQWQQARLQLQAVTVQQLLHPNKQSFGEGNTSFMHAITTGCYDALVIHRPLHVAWTPNFN